VNEPFKSYEEAMQYLFHFTDYERMAKPRDAATSVFGLARMNQLLAFLDNPHERLRVIHIAGTKGKGSMARCGQPATGWGCSPRRICTFFESESPSMASRSRSMKWHG